MFFIVVEVLVEFVDVNFFVVGVVYSFVDRIVFFVVVVVARVVCVVDLFIDFDIWCVCV